MPSSVAVALEVAGSAAAAEAELEEDGEEPLCGVVPLPALGNGECCCVPRWPPSSFDRRALARIRDRQFSAADNGGGEDEDSNYSDRLGSTAAEVLSQVAAAVAATAAKIAPHSA